MGDKKAEESVGWGLSFGFFGACVIMSIALQQLNHQGTMTGLFNSHWHELKCKR
jgi:hypothetical protein